MTKPVFKAKNLQYIESMVFTRLIITLVCFSFAAFYMGDHRLILSAFLGALFSFLGFRQLIRVQIKIVQTQSKSISLPLFLLRLVLYAAPLILYFSFEKYLNLWIILVFLFSSQVIWIATEIQIRLKKLRKRK